MSVGVFNFSILEMTSTTTYIYSLIWTNILCKEDSLLTSVHYLFPFPFHIIVVCVLCFHCYYCYYCSFGVGWGGGGISRNCSHN